MFRSRGENLRSTYILLFLNVAFFMLQYQDARQVRAPLRLRPQRRRRGAGLAALHVSIHAGRARRPHHLPADPDALPQSRAAVADGIRGRRGMGHRQLPPLLPDLDAGHRARGGLVQHAADGIVLHQLHAAVRLRRAESRPDVLSLDDPADPRHVPGLDGAGGAADRRLLRQQGQPRGAGRSGGGIRVLHVAARARAGDRRRAICRNSSMPPMPRSSPRRAT